MAPGNRLTVAWDAPVSQLAVYFFDHDPADSGTTDHGISLLGNVMQQVPEPSGVLLLCGAGSLALLRRHRRTA